MANSNNFPFAPGEEFKYLFSLSRREQIETIVARALWLRSLLASDDALDTGLMELEYAAYVTREAIFCEGRTLNEQLATKPPHIIQQPTTIEDLI